MKPIRYLDNNNPSAGPFSPRDFLWARYWALPSSKGYGLWAPRLKVAHNTVITSLEGFPSRAWYGTTEYTFKQLLKDPLAKVQAVSATLGAFAALCADGPAVFK